MLFILVFTALLSATFSLDCGHDGELLPDVTNCRKYFKCSNGRPSTQSCPGTLIFDPVLKICNWPDSTSCVQEKPKEPPKRVKLSDEANNRERDTVKDREEVSSLFHIKERDFSSLRDRHRRLRQRIRDRDKAEATTTTTTRKPVNRFVSDNDDDRDTNTFRSRGALLHRNRQDNLSKEKERQALIERLNRNRFETVDSNPSPGSRGSQSPGSRGSQSSGLGSRGSQSSGLGSRGSQSSGLGSRGSQSPGNVDSEKEKLLEKLNQFEREREELIQRLNQLESGPEAPRVEVTTKKPRKKLKPIVCRENNELHANPKSCRKYFKCENGLPSLQSCPANLIFDANINVCNWPDATECIEDPDAILPTLGSSDVHPPSAAIFRRPPPPSSSVSDDQDFFSFNSVPTAPSVSQGIPPTLQEALQKEKKITSEYPYFSDVLATVQTLDNDEVENISPKRSANPDNVRRVEFILSEENFEDLFPRRHRSYTYTRLLQAIGKFPAICGYRGSETKSDEICRRTLATMFAHFAQETGEHNNSDKEVEEWRQGLAHLRELGCTDTSPGCKYNDNCEKTDSLTKKWACGKDRNGEWKKYYGRGAKQLSYNFNYGQFSQAMFGEGRLLLDHPDFVADTWLNLASATWFYVTPQPPKPSMLHVIDGTWVPNSADQRNGINPGFGATINIINGGIECNKPNGETRQARHRAEYYKEFAWYLYVDYEKEDLGCSRQGQFTQDGAGALPIYWDKDWSEPFACKLVPYQTAHSALVPGEYVDCLEESFNVNIR